MTTQTWLTQGEGLVEMDDMRRFMKDCIVKAGAPENNAEIFANVLITADYRGHFAQGLNNLEKNVKRIRTGQIRAGAEPRVLKENAATAWVDGMNALGPVVGNFCIRLAIEKAKNRGMGWVTAKSSNDIIIASYYTMQALEEGLIGFACTTFSPVMSPAAVSKKPLFGSNRLSLSAPALYKDSIVLDMPCSAQSMGQVELCRRTQRRLGQGWALNELGHPTADPSAAMRAWNIMPLGSLIKGTADRGCDLACGVDCLSAVLAGGKSGPNVLDMRNEGNRPAGYCQSFMVIDPKRFAPGYERRLFDLMYRMRGQDPENRKKKVMVPGDPEREHMKKVDRSGGILYHSNLLKNGLALAQFLEVEPFKIK